MHVIGCAHHDRVDLLLEFLQHLTIVRVLGCLRVFGVRGGGTTLVHIAQRDDILVCHGSQIIGAASARPDHRDSQFLVLLITPGRPTVAQDDDSRAALAECAAIAGEWLRLVDQARDNPEHMEELGRAVPAVLTHIMTRAGDALEAAGYDVAAEVDAAVERIADTHGMDWH